MKINATLEEVVNGDRGILKGIQACLDAQCLVSAIALIYAGIDALSALTRPKEQPETKGAVFIGWVNAYMKLTCTPRELWGARCGVLHTYSPESSMKGARQLVYQWRDGPPANQTMPLPDGALVIVVEDLRKAFEDAVKKFLHAATMDKNISDTVEHHLPKLLCYTPCDTSQQWVAAAE